MDMDLKPVSRPGSQPNTVVNPGAPAPTPAEDPFKADPPVVPSTPVKKKRGGAFKKLLVILLILVLIGGVGYGVYYWQQQQVDKLTKQNAALTAELATTKADAAKAESEEEPVQLTADEQVIAVVKARCEASLDETTKKPLVYIQGTTKDKKVTYSTDKTFAYVNSSCGMSATDTSATARATYLKSVNGNWVFLYSGQSADATLNKLYGVPADADFK